MNEHAIIGPEYQHTEGLGRLRIYDKRAKLPKHRMVASPTERGWRFWHVE